MTPDNIDHLIKNKDKCPYADCYKVHYYECKIHSLKDNEKTNEDIQDRR